ncbi:MAG: DUF2157 domain-containing protein [Candidatus Omnitrophota bacterium]
MNKKMVLWLYQELPALVGKGVLTQASSDSLRAHYGEVKAVDRRSFVVILCAIIGSLLIGLGIILLFAHNWEQFSRPTRAGLSLLPLVMAQALALWVVFKKPDSLALKESSATFLSLMVGSSLALIGQTYNIPNDTPAFILTWMLLILPLAYLMEASIPAVMYVFGISAWAGQFWRDPSWSILFWPLLALVVPHFIWSLKQEKYAIRSTILAFVMAIGICSGVGFTRCRGWEGSWVVIYSSLATVFYFLGSWEFHGISTNWQRPFARVGAFGVFVMMFLFTFDSPWHSLSFHDVTTLKPSAWVVVPDVVLAGLLFTGSLLMTYPYIQRRDWVRVQWGALPLFALFGYTFGGSSEGLVMLIFNLYVLFISIYRIMAGIKANDLGITNTGMFMLSALVLARFFDSNLDFIFKGLVFIAVGIGFLLTNIMVMRKKGGAA